MKINYTPAQKRAIHTRNKPLLLSAAAGSGKTAVLVARILDIISDETNGINITDLLTVTFTNLAAAQMKERIYKELISKIKEFPENKKLKKQLLYLSNAKIKTIHSFCLELIKENTDFPEIPVGFRIADEAEERSLKSRVLNEFTEELYKREDSEFYDIINTYAFGRDDENFVNLISATDRATESFEDKDAFFESCLEKLYTASENFEKSEYADFLKRHIRLFCGNAVKSYEKATQIAEENPDYERFVPFFGEEKEFFSQLLSEDDIYELQKKALNYKFPTLPSKRGVDTSFFKTLRTEIKNSFQKTAVIPYLNFDFEAEEEYLKEIYLHLKNIISVYKKFDSAVKEAKKKKNLLFFKDFEIYAIKLLRNEDGTPSPVTNALKDEFYEILIDEYQDTSELQNTIFELISRNGKNFFTVGDIKQSIYKFRDAKPELFINRANAYASGKNGGEVIYLKENFRSRKQVIDSINSVFSRIMTEETSKTDYKKEMLVLGGENPPEAEGCDYTTEILLFPGKRTDGEYEDSLNEGKMIANRIKKLFDEKFMVYDSKKNIHRPISYGDIVILTRDMKSETTRLLYSTLTENNIPVISELEEDFFQKTEISVIIGILKAIDNPFDDLSLLTLLKSPPFHLNETELLEIRLCDEYAPFYNALKKSDNEKAVKTVKFIKEFSEKAAIYDVSLLISELYERLKIYEYFSTFGDYEQKIFNIDLLYKVVCDYKKNENGALKGFLNYIKHCRPKFQNSKNSDAVKMLTIHKSKGLEFPVVILAETGKSLSKRNNDAKFYIYNNEIIGMNYVSAGECYTVPTASMKIVKNMVEYDEISEQLRLLYVAMTRAKEKLIITANIQNSAFSKWAVVRETGGHSLYTLYASKSFISWIMPSSENSPFFKTTVIESFDDEELSENEEKKSENNTGNNPAKKKRDFEIDEAVFYEYKNKERTELPMKVTVSHANRLAKESAEGGSPIGFCVDELDEMNDKYSGSEYGTYFHKMFELCDTEAIKRGEKPENVINELFESKFIEYTEYSEEAVLGIKNFFESSLGKELLLSDCVKKEVPFLVRIAADKIFGGSCKDEILLQGATDCYFEKGGKITLIDFKTDKNPDEEKIRKNYTKQILLYSYAIEQVTGMKVEKKVIYTVRNSKIIEI